MAPIYDALTLVPADQRLDLVAPPVAAALAYIPDAMVAAIDPGLADTEAFCAAYGLSLIHI